MTIYEQFKDVKPLSGAKSFELLERYKQGDIQARNELITGSIPVIMRYINYAKVANFDDLFQTVCLDFIEFIERCVSGDRATTDINFAPIRCKEISRSVNMYIKKKLNPKKGVELSNEIYYIINRNKNFMEHEYIEHLLSIPSTPKRRFVLRAYYIDGKPKISIAKELGVTNNRVDQLMSRGISDIRHRLRFIDALEEGGVPYDYKHIL